MISMTDDETKFITLKNFFYSDTRKSKAKHSCKLQSLSFFHSSHLQGYPFEAL